MAYLPNVPRCQHLKVNGTQCGSPALRRNRFCFFHKSDQEQRIKLNASRRGRATFTLPVLEDADSVQVSSCKSCAFWSAGKWMPRSPACFSTPCKPPRSTCARSPSNPVV
jgi:hypothetical protein